MDRIKLPKIGLGTWMLTGETCTKSVIDGLDMGYRLIDTAQIYGNEKEVGAAISTTSVPRKDYILATKLWIANFSPKKVYSSFKVSLSKLQTDYVDILYVHWPITLTYRPEKTLGAMNELVKEGVVRYIGVSNFPIYRIQEAIDISETPILANQVEMHPRLRLQKLHAYNTSKNVYTVAYSPLGRGKIWNNPVLMEIAQKNEISVPEVCLSYVMSRGAVPIPKASSKAHLLANWNSQDITLSQEDISKIENIPEKRLLHMPIVGPKWDKDD
ncbi:MAG: aldo/keto reductase [Promethearchaeota archaeon]